MLHGDGIFTHDWVNVGKYAIHGAFGLVNSMVYGGYNCSYGVNLNQLITGEAHTVYTLYILVYTYIPPKWPI
jgi:hypothetical protein